MFALPFSHLNQVPVFPKPEAATVSSTHEIVEAKNEEKRLSC